MTQRSIEDRYHSTSGLKHDLVRIRELLSEGDGEGLKSFQVGSKDISCFFNLPLKQIGRDKERQVIIDVIERVSKRRRGGAKLINSLSSNSSYSDQRLGEMTLDDVMSDSTSSRGSESIHQRSQDSVATIGSIANEASESRPKLQHLSSRGQSNNNSFESSLSHARSYQSNDGLLLRPKPSTRSHQRKTRCEVVAIGGATGLGKSRLVQSVQSTARVRNFFSSAARSIESERILEAFIFSMCCPNVLATLARTCLSVKRESQKTASWRK
jgi:hypothetical protein